MKKYLIAGIITLLVIVGGIFLLRGLDKGNNSLFETEHEYFTAIVETALIEQYGQIIGYEPNMIIDIFGNLVNEDFDGVQTEFGQYEVLDGGLAFRPSPGESFSENKTYISAEGMETLLSNVSTRLGIEIVDERSVDELVTTIFKAK